MPQPPGTEVVLERADAVRDLVDDQELSGVQVTTPPGLLGVLKSVPLCGEADANAGTCQAVSQIGHTTVGSGAGTTPVSRAESGRRSARRAPS